MSKSAFHQNLVGRTLYEEPAGKFGQIETKTFRYFSLNPFMPVEGQPFVRIEGAWIENASVKLIVSDSNGKLGELYATNFVIGPERN